MIYSLKRSLQPNYNSSKTSPAINMSQLVVSHVQSGIYHILDLAEALNAYAQSTNMCVSNRMLPAVNLMATGVVNNKGFLNVTHRIFKHLTVSEVFLSIVTNHIVRV